MIDITKIQPFDVPPEIKVLKNENNSLIKTNRSLLYKNNIFIGVIALSLIIAGIIYYTKQNEDKQQK
jgi:hypothetical protein